MESNGEAPKMLNPVRARRLARAIGYRFAALVLLALASAVAAAQSIPERFADSTYWRMISEMSEPDGYFRSDNFASNELSFQYVIPELNRVTRPRGVYLGVGPDQNYTYIAAMKPKIAFIVDIRRQNMMLHLMYKALMEMSADRVTFTARLFSRPRPAGVDTNSSADQILNAVYLSPRTQKEYDDNFAAVREHLVTKHKFALSPIDLASIHYVYSTFFSLGPGINYQGSSNGQPTYWDLQVETDLLGVQRGYMASEANYRTLKEMHERNLIVPLVGDFGGARALRSVARYLTDNKETVSAFYLSNVEQYLFQSDAWVYFYRNVGAMPLDSTSTFIRSVFNNQGGMRMNTRNGNMNLLASMTEQLKMFNDGRLNSYAAVINSSR
jgi:hypothetical protein